MEAFVTLVTNDEYATGALVLGHSLRDVHTTRQLVVLTTAAVSSATSELLKSVFDLVKVVNLLDSYDTSRLELLSRPELGVTLTKINCWRLTQFTKCVFLDADTLVLQNIDELFEREEFSAAPDIGWPDCFNSGVFVFSPSDETYNNLLQFMTVHGSFDGGDQGLLNSFFSDWATKDITKHLPFIYNVVTQTFYSYLPALKQFGRDVKVVHFIGSEKPWHNSSENFVSSEGSKALGDRSSVHGQQFLTIWQKIFHERIQPLFQRNEGIQQHYLTSLSLTSPFTVTPDDVQVFEEKSLEATNLADPSRRFEWEKGDIDYMGMDRFDNILKQLDETINGNESMKTKEGTKQFP